MPSKNTLGIKTGEAKSETSVVLLNQQVTKKTDIICRPIPGLFIIIKVDRKLWRITINYPCLRLKHTTGMPR